MGLRVKSLKPLQDELNKITREWTQAALYSAKEIAETIYQNSQELVPVDTGRLKSSGQVISLNEDYYNGRISYAVTYEAFDPISGYEYAPVQHEELGFKHTIGQARYLADAIDFSQIDRIMRNAYNNRTY